MCHKSEYKSLSDQDLLGLFVSESTASSLMEQYSTLEEVLLHAYPEELEQIEGLDINKGNQLSAIGEMANRLFNQDKRDMVKIHSPGDVYQLLKDMQNLKKEEIRAVFLNTKHDVIRIETISIGNSDSSMLRAKEVYAKGVRALASGIILAHNHPSGDPTPSTKDLQVTKRIKEAGQILSIELLDHIIIGKNCYHSIQEHQDIDWR